MIKRYDEIIAQKANKTSIIDIEKKAYERYAKKDTLKDLFDDHEERLKSLFTDYKKLDGTVTFLRRELSNAITGAVEKAGRNMEERMNKKPIKESWKAYFVQGLNSERTIDYNGRSESMSR